MKRVLVTTILSLIILTTLPYTTILAELPEFPKNEEAYIIEGTSKSTIVDQNSNKEIELGELTDLMVAKVSLDALQGKLSDQIKLTKEDIEFLGSDNLGIFNYEQSLTYQDLLNILLLTSNDNASKLLGINIGKKVSGKDDIDNTEALNSFIEKLNETCGELKLSNTKFSDLTGEKNTSTPVDVATIAQTTLEDKLIQSIIKSNDYEVKLKEFKENTEEQEKKESSEEEQEKEKIITIENKNAYILSVINSDQDIKNENSQNELVSEDLDTDSKYNDSQVSNEEMDEKENETNDSQLVDEIEGESNEEAVTAAAYQVNSINDSKETNPTKSNSTVGYFSNIENDQTIGVFLTDLDGAQIIGTLADLSGGEIGNQINSVLNELKNNYEFVDLSDNEAITTQYKLENAHFSSPKSISLSGIDSLKAYLPTTKTNPKTEVVWNEDFVKPTGEKYQLIQSLEPLTQIATMQIKVGNQIQSLPLYNTDKVTIKNWTDSLLKYGLISLLVLIFLLIIWRLIYVHNRRKVLRRKRLRRLKRKRQLQTRQLAIQQSRNQSK